MIEQDWAESFAQGWIAAWNAGDIERILAHYAEDFELASPLVIERMGIANGKLRGKDAVRPYWEIGLARSPPLHFVLLNVLVGVNALAIVYESTTRGCVVVERIEFDQQKRAIRAEVLYEPSLD
jgi:ketosteroid isomerase-like protein